jgi:trigger factor
MKNIHEIKVVIEKEEWKEKVDKAFEKLQKNAKVDGFRKGKVPRNVFEKKNGKETIWYEAINDALDEKYLNILQEKKLIPIIRPNIEVVSVDDNKAEIKFIITTKPEVKISKYKDLGVKKGSVKVTEKEINEEIENLRQRYADMTVKKGKIEKGDTAIIDFEGFIDDTAFEGGKGENYSLTIGSNTFIPGFEDQLIGLKENDTKDVKVKFPEDYHSEDLKGKDAVFKVKVHEVKTKKLPELDKDFFLDLEMENVTTLEELKEKIKEEIKHHKTHEVENKYIDDILEEVSKNTEVEIPNELIEEEIDRMLEEYANNLRMQGIDLDTYYKFTNSNESMLREQMRNEADKRVKYRLMLEEIVKLEKIKVTDEEIDKELNEMARQYNMTEEEVLKHMGSKDVLKYEIEMQKAIDVLKK